MKDKRLFLVAALVFSMAFTSCENDPVQGSTGTAGGSDAFQTEAEIFSEAETAEVSRGTVAWTPFY